MKIQSYLILSMVLSLLFSFNFTGQYGLLRGPGLTEARAGITSTIQEASAAIKELRTTAEGAGRFFSAVSSVVSTFTSIAGWRALVLLFGVILISAVLTFIGIPRGGVSFLISLAVADWIWVLWEKSFTPDLPVHYAALIKANAVLLLPFVAVMVIKKVIPLVGSKIGAGTVFIFKLPFFKKKIVPKNLLLHELLKYNEASGMLQRRLLEDIMKSGRDRVILSGDTVESIHEVERVLEEMQDAGHSGSKESSNKDDRNDPV